jgi:hypothetical protein
MSLPPAIRNDAGHRPLVVAVCAPETQCVVQGVATVTFSQFFRRLSKERLVALRIGCGDEAKARAALAKSTCVASEAEVFITEDPAMAVRGADMVFLVADSVAGVGDERRSFMALKQAIDEDARSPCVVALGLPQPQSPAFQFFFSWNMRAYIPSWDISSISELLESVWERRSAAALATDSWPDRLFADVPDDVLHDDLLLGGGLGDGSQELADELGDAIWDRYLQADGDEQMQDVPMTPPPMTPPPMTPPPATPTTPPAETPASVAPPAPDVELLSEPPSPFQAPPPLPAAASGRASAAPAPSPTPETAATSRKRAAPRPHPSSEQDCADRAEGLGGGSQVGGRSPANLADGLTEPAGASRKVQARERKAVARARVKQLAGEGNPHAMKKLEDETERARRDARKRRFKVAMQKLSESREAAWFEPLWEACLKLAPSFCRSIHWFFAEMCKFIGAMTKGARLGRAAQEAQNESYAEREKFRRSAFSTCPPGSVGSVLAIVDNIFTHSGDDVCDVIDGIRSCMKATSRPGC